MSIGDFPEILSQQILLGIILVGRLGVRSPPLDTRRRGSCALRCWAELEPHARARALRRTPRQTRDLERPSAPASAVLPVVMPLPVLPVVVPPVVLPLVLSVILYRWCCCRWCCCRCRRAICRVCTPSVRLSVISSSRARRYLAAPLFGLELRPISLLRFSLLRFLDSNFL